MNSTKKHGHKLATRLIHEGQDPEQWTHREVIPPISLSTTFQQPSPGKPVTYDYARCGNPTRACLEACLASLEGANHAFTFSSGLAALTTLTYVLKSGDHLISGEDIYGGTNRLFRHALARMGIEVTFVDARDVEEIKKAIKPNTRMIWLETPTNPTMTLADIPKVAQLKRDSDIVLAVDNTFMTPIFQKPLELGADVVVYSLTKYMNGHSDAMMGAIITNDERIAETAKFFQKSLGAMSSPFDCFLVNRGLKTLHLRMECHMKNSLEVARFLETHPKVVKVFHPGLKSHPQHELAVKQASGFSGMLSFELKGGKAEAAKFTQSLKIFSLAESLGGIESLVEIPSLMTHTSVPIEQRKKLGISDSLIRLSVGIEGIEDLVEDIKQALDKC